MTLKREYDNMPNEFRHLVANSDEEIRELEQAAHPLHTDFALPTTSTLSAAESARLTQQIESKGLIEELLGITYPTMVDVPDSVMPLGVNGQPLSKSAADELEASFRRLVNAVVTGVENGDPEALALVESGRDRGTAVDSLIQRMAAHADEFLPDSVAGAFIKAFAAGDRAAMRRAVRPIVEELVAAGA